MNEYNLEIPRKRRKNLLIIEGNHEKNKLFQLIFQTFPEIEINIEDVLIYGTNIYMLYNDIVMEYGDEWYEEDVDLPFIVGKKNKHYLTLNKNDFINIFLVFDYERHDPNFSEQKIMNMQQYFSDSADMGKLYINYPMIESYQHFSCFPDDNFDSLTIEVTLQPGSQYKGMLRDTFMNKCINLQQKLEEILSDRYKIQDIKVCKKCTKKILEISSSVNLVEHISQILTDYILGLEINTAKYQIQDLIMSKGYLQKNMSYYEYMRENLKQIILHNINKGIKIQNSNLNGINYRTLFETLDLIEILNVQNSVSRNAESGYIWVLNTCVFIVPDYNFTLIE